MRGSSGGFFTHKYRIVASSLLAPDTLLISSIIHSFFHYIYSHFSSLLSLFCIRQAVLVSFLWTWFYSYCLFHLSAPEFYDTLRHSTTLSTTLSTTHAFVYPISS